MMQGKNKFMDDMSQIMTNAMGVAQGAKDEAENAMKSVMDRWLADRACASSALRPLGTATCATSA